ncbi:MAG: CBS domain-containing protein [Bacteroidota bacterium]
MKTVDKIMTTEVITVFETATFSEIKRVFDTHHFHHIPVLDFSNQLKGIISKEDLAKASYILTLNTTGKTYTEKEFDYISAKDIMSSYPVFLTPDDEIDLAADVFLSNKLHALPILDDGHLVGIVTTHDLLRYSFTEMRTGVYPA